MIIHICNHNLKVDGVLQWRNTIVFNKYIELHRERGEGERREREGGGEEGEKQKSKMVYVINASS